MDQTSIVSKSDVINAQRFEAESDILNMVKNSTKL